MSNIKEKAQGVHSTTEPMNLLEVMAKTGNIYESLAIITKRARQLAVDTKSELHSKLDEFATHGDTLEELHENKEQIEISKYYERLPNSVLIALNEFMEDKIYFRMKEDETEAEKADE